MLFFKSKWGGLELALLLPIIWSRPSKAQSASGFFPKGTNLTSLVVISESNLTNSAQKTLIATLQGIVARRSNQQIYIDGGNGYSLFYKYLNTAYGIPFTVATNPWTILSQFQSIPSGYILFDKTANSNSLNAATSLCGPFNAIAVDASIEAMVRSLGITNRIADVRTHNDMWVWTNYPGIFNSNIVAEQMVSFDDDLRDYATMANVFTFFEGNSSFRDSVVSHLNPDAVSLGWGDASQGESVFVGDSSIHGVFTIASDYALNLSTLSSVRDSSISQKTFSNPVTETNVHYVTFIMSDGDNVQWNLGGEPTFYNNSVRGQFSMGWSLSASLADLAPSALRWHYDYASAGMNRDFFVAGPSGSGYMYPSKYPPADLTLHVAKLNDFMGRADMNLGQIIDFNSFNRLDMWNQYLAQPNIDGLFYLEYTQYNGEGGAIEFSSNGKPIIACRENLVAGGETESNIISNINSYPRDPSSPSGYTFVCVTVWSKSQANVLQVKTNLASDVRVVTPDVFAKLIRNNIGRKLSYDFATSLQGWVGATNGKAYDRAQWTSTVGNPAGALLLDGSDIGVADSQPNSWFSRQIILPVNATTLAFDTSADNDGLLRVRLLLANGSYVTLRDWAGLSSHNTWVSYTNDISSYAGQTVTVLFEQNDGGQGSGEYRYVDNVAIQSAGAPLYLPAAPKLISAIGTTNVTLLWRDNDVNENGFSVERSSGTNGAWSIIATVASGVTNYVDNSIGSIGSIAYRLRSTNGAGYSSYSNVQTNSPPTPRPLAGPANAGFEAGSADWNTGDPGGAAGAVSFVNYGANGFSSSGTNCLLETSDGSLGATGNGVDFRADYFSLGAAALAAKPITFAFDYNILSAVKSGNQIRVGLRFEDAAGDFLGEHNSYIGAPNGDTGGQGWKHFSVTTVSTSTALSADIRVSMNVFGDDTWSSGGVLFDNFTVLAGNDSAPVVNNISLGTLIGLPVTKQIIGGSAPATDANGDFLTVTTVTQPTHGAASTDGVSLTYMPSAGYVGSDSFKFTVSDGVGGLTSATATMVVNGPGTNRFIGSSLLTSNNYLLSYSGAARCAYVLESTGSLTPPAAWMPQLTNIADASGLAAFTNYQAASEVFWRVRYSTTAP